MDKIKSAGTDLDDRVLMLGIEPLDGDRGEIQQPVHAFVRERFASAGDHAPANETFVSGLEDFHFNAANVHQPFSYPVTSCHVGGTPSPSRSIPKRVFQFFSFPGCCWRSTRPLYVPRSRSSSVMLIFITRRPAISYSTMSPLTCVPFVRAVMMASIAASVSSSKVWNAPAGELAALGSTMITSSSPVM